MFNDIIWICRDFPDLDVTRAGPRATFILSRPGAPYECMFVSTNTFKILLLRTNVGEIFDTVDEVVYTFSRLAVALTEKASPRDDIGRGR